MTEIPIHHKLQLLILFLMISGLFIATDLSAQNVTKYSNAYFGFAFDYPAEWDQMTYPGEIILVKEKAGKELANLATFDVTADSSTRNIHSYCNSYESVFRTGDVFSEFKVVSKQDTVFSGVPAIEYHCTATAGGLPLEWKSVILLHRDKILKLSTASMIGLFDLKRETTDSIFRSFSLN